METTFLVWSASEGSQGRGEPGVGGVYIDQPTAVAPPPAGAINVEQGLPPPLPPLRPAKAKKKPAGPKKPPQRGLGVEQLERLRLQEQWNKLAEAEFSAGVLPARYHRLPHSYKGNRDMGNHAFRFRRCPLYEDPEGYSLARFPAAPLPEGCGGDWGESAFLHGGAPEGVLVANPVGFAAAKPAVPKNSVLNRYRAASEEASLQVGNGAFTEFPSSQSLQCSERYCDLCSGKKRMLEEKLGMGEDNKLKERKTTLNLLWESRRTTAASPEGIADARRDSTEKKLQDYLFFPGSSSQGGSTLEGRMMAGDAPSSSSCFHSREQLDLSLNLSSCSPSGWQS